MANILNCMHGAFMQLYTFGMYNQLKRAKEEGRKKTLARNIVAAGDPTQEEHKKEKELTLPETVSYKGLDISCNEFETWVVDGYSMSPEDINNGDVLLCKPVYDTERENLGYGKYIVINVDPQYYAFKKKDLCFQKKLRKALMKVAPDTDIETLIDKLKQIDDSVLLSDNEKCLREKYKDIKSFYKEEELMLSLTYRDGALRYSFHPISLITSVAEYALSKQKNGWNVNKL